jgi:hypothetical protein
MSALVAMFHVPPIEQQQLVTLAKTLKVYDAAPCRLATWRKRSRSFGDRKSALTR